MTGTSVQNKNYGNIVTIIIIITNEELRPRAGRLSLRSHSPHRHKLPRSLTSVQLGVRDPFAVTGHICAPGRQRVACSPSVPGMTDQSPSHSSLKTLCSLSPYDGLARQRGGWVRLFSRSVPSGEGQLRALGPGQGCGFLSRLGHSSSRLLPCPRRPQFPHQKMKGLGEI